MKSIKEKLSGIYPPVVTPFENDEILYDGLRENIEKLNSTGIRGYFVAGTNGEFRSLTTAERLKVIETAAEAATGNKVVMAGTAAESTKETIEITKAAADAGAELVSLLVPSFFKKIIDDAVIISYIIDVAEVSPVPVLLYNNPSVTGGVLVSPEVIAEVSKHPNVVGIKDSSKGNFESYIQAATDDFYVLAGSAGFLLELLKAGGTGGVVSLANVFPQACADLYDSYIKGNYEHAEKLSSDLVALNKQVSGPFAVAGVKAAMNIVGFRGGEPRRPLKALGREQIEEIRIAIEESPFREEIQK
jgi:4-hydroxy-2-oxoglutarate aldolase